MNQDDGTISEKEFKIISKIASKDEINVLINELSVTQDEDEEDGRYSKKCFFFKLRVNCVHYNRLYLSLELIFFFT